jgi:hypothetical protein
MGSDDELTQRWLRREDYNEAPVILEGEMNVEEGRGFMVSAWFSGTVAGGISEAAIFNPYTNKELDFFWGATCGEAITAYFYEGPVLDASGTVLTPRNLNRTIGDVPSLTQVLVFVGPTPANRGTLLSTEFIPEGVLGMGYGRGHVAPGFKWVLKPRTWYLVSIRNEAAQDSAIISGIGEWWERSDYFSEREELV